MTGNATAQLLHAGDEVQIYYESPAPERWLPVGTRGRVVAAPGIPAAWVTVDFALPSRPSIFLVRPCYLRRLGDAEARREADVPAGETALAPQDHQETIA
jgi:hypothetical protein